MSFKFRLFLDRQPGKVWIRSIGWLALICFFAVPGKAMSHEVSGISQAQYSGAFYEGCRRNASAKYCQCVQDQYGTHFNSRAEMIAAMLGAGPQAQRMLRHAISYCRDGKASVPMERNSRQAEQQRQENARKRQEAKAAGVKRRTALIVKHLSRKTTLSGLLRAPKTKWKFSHYSLKIERFSEKSQSFSGTIRWKKRGISHPVTGKYDGARIDFQEARASSASSKDTQCRYHVIVYNDPRRLQGQWRCKAENGYLSLDFPKR